MGSLRGKKGLSQVEQGTRLTQGCLNRSVPNTYLHPQGVPVWSLHSHPALTSALLFTRNRLVTGGRGYPICPPIPTKPSPVQWHANLNKVQMGL